MLDPAGSKAFSFLTPAQYYSLCLALAVLFFADLDVLKRHFSWCLTLGEVIR